MRILLVAHNAYTEHTSGAARSVRTIMEWLRDGGHDCRAVTTGRFDQSPGLTIEAHHADLAARFAIETRRETGSGTRPILRYTLNGVAVTAVETRHAGRLDPDPEGDSQFAAEIADALAEEPDLVFAYGHHLLVHAGLKFAREQGARTIYTVRAWGYDQRSWFENADRVLVNSGYAARHYAAKPGVRADWLPSPFVWREILAPVETRGFVTFVNPSPHKGLLPFARLAEMVGRRRPDIPLLIVHSSGNAALLNDGLGVDLARHGNIMVSPPVSDPRQFLGLTRILLVPSVFEEPFGRVAAEAMINGIPPIVSDRGGLPETVGDGGIVLNVPAWLTQRATTLPSEAEMEPWFDALVRLWDDKAEYARASTAAATEGRRLYGETMLRARYLAWFESPPPYPPVFLGTASG
jgi:glycosyltransferase involved in cell wall biosynthesis